MKDVFPLPKPAKRTGFCPNCDAEMVNTRNGRQAMCSRDPGCCHLVEAFTREQRNANRVRHYGTARNIGRRHYGRFRA